MDKSLVDDGPETPAHLFAIRALKTAFFGTPAPPQPNRDKTETTKPPGRDPIDHPAENLVLEPVKEIANAGTSPTKSILVTPGASVAAARRKTVSFSGLRHEIKPSDISSSIESSPDSKDAGGADDTEAHRDPRRSLFLSRSSPMNENADDASTHQETRKHLERQGWEDGNTTSDSAGNADETLDLKTPRSRSGKHWKQEYQREHDKSKTEMQKLIRYSQMAKSYAVKRDDEAVRMRERLVEAEAKVKEMETTVAQLAAELATSRVDDDGQADILNELAQQTAQALRYKQKAERYQAILEHDEQLKLSEKESSNRPTREQLQAQRLKDDQERLARANSEALEKRAASLEEENARLRRTVGRFKDDLKRYEERHKLWLQERRRKDERANAKKNALREQVATLTAENSRLAVELEHAKKARSDRAEVKERHSSQKDQMSRSKPHNDVVPAVPAPTDPAQPLWSSTAVQPYSALHGVQTVSQTARESSRAPRRTRASEVQSLRQRLEGKLSSSAVRPQEESLDLWNLPSVRDEVPTEAKDDFHLSVSQQDFAGNHPPVATSLPGKATSKDRTDARRDRPRAGRDQTKPIKTTSIPVDRISAAKEQLAALLADKNYMQSSRDEGKENVKPVAAT